MPASEVMHKWSKGTLRSGGPGGPKVKSQKQAIAIMLSEKRQEQKHGGRYPEKAFGGSVRGYDSGGGIDPVQAVITALQSGTGVAGNLASAGSSGGPSIPPSGASPTTAATTAVPPSSTIAPAQQSSLANPASSAPASTPGMVSGPASVPAPAPQQISQPVTLTLPAPPTMPNPSAPSPSLFPPTGVASPTWLSSGATPAGSSPAGIGVAGIGSLNRAAGGAGSFDMAKAPHVGMTGPAAYPARAMMRSMTRGALLTPTMGRADAHRTFVPSGSYVVPADVVSGRGQGNTLAGAGTLHQMFGMGGPYGAGKAGPYGGAMGGIKASKGPQMPKPPKIQTSILSASGGGKEGAADHLGEPVPVNLSGGEVVVPPENLLSTFRRIFPGKNYTLKQIHAMMDQWVLDERKQHRKTLAKLPGPAKD